MSTRTLLSTACVAMFLVTVGIAADGQLISEARLLSASDIGKTFVKVDEEPHPNFGHYLLLTSVNDMYGFDSFDLHASKPVGKLHVSYFPSPRFREVAIAPETMKMAREAIKRADEEHSRSLEEWRRSLEPSKEVQPPNKSLERTRDR